MTDDKTNENIDEFASTESDVIETGSAVAEDKETEEKSKRFWTKTKVIVAVVIAIVIIVAGIFAYSQYAHAKEVEEFNNAAIAVVNDNEDAFHAIVAKYGDGVLYVSVEGQEEPNFAENAHEAICNAISELKDFRATLDNEDLKNSMADYDGNNDKYDSLISMVDDEIAKYTDILAKYWDKEVKAVVPAECGSLDRDSTQASIDKINETATKIDADYATYAFTDEETFNGLKQHLEEGKNACQARIDQINAEEAEAQQQNGSQQSGNYGSGNYSGNNSSGGYSNGGSGERWAVATSTNVLEDGTIVHHEYSGTPEDVVNQAQQDDAKDFAYMAAGKYD